jgi:hypothetical protein
MSLYDRVCAYSCFRIHPVTGSRSVDHFAAKSRRWDRVYEWNNYRLSCSLLNARKNEFDDVLDPIQVDDGWFQLELVGFQIVPNPQLHIITREVIQRTIDRLGLDEFREALRTLNGIGIEKSPCLFFRENRRSWRRNCDVRGDLTSVMLDASE